jgi:RNA polymerase sigma-70 factor (ECF subfamily)
VNRELVERARGGDREAFSALVDGSARRLVGTAGLILRDAGRGEDAAQEALIRAWRDLPSLRDVDRFDAWLYRLLVRACQDQLRRSRREIPTAELLPSHVSLTEDAADALADRDEIDRGLSRLSRDQRTVVVLRYYGGLSDREVGEAIGLPVGTVKSRLNRALAAMRAELDADARGARSEERLA